MSDEVRRTVERLQRAADGYGKGEVEMMLAHEPHLYRLPKCTKAGLIVRSPDKAELLLDTEDDHRFLIEMDSEVAESLYRLLEITFKGAQGA